MSEPTLNDLREQWESCVNVAVNDSGRADEEIALLGAECDAAAAYIYALEAECNSAFQALSEAMSACQSAKAARDLHYEQSGESRRLVDYQFDQAVEKMIRVLQARIVGALPDLAPELKCTRLSLVRGFTVDFIVHLDDDVGALDAYLRDAESEARIVHYVGGDVALLRTVDGEIVGFRIENVKL